MMTLGLLVKRNVKLFFKDRGMFFSALITPMILLVLYVTFLGNVYRDSFLSGIPKGFLLDEKVLNGLVSGQLISSILSVSCVTVAFCSNMLIVQDKVSGSRNDFIIAPVKPSILALGYYIAALFSTILICFAAAGAGLVYIGLTGWYMNASDLCFLFLDVFLLALFGTAISSIINCFLNSQGQISAIGTIVSAGYGFICGAYMPLSQFPEGLRKALAFLPGTYGTSLVRNHVMQGAFREKESQGVSSIFLEMMRDAVDCNLYFFNHKVTVGTMYLILIGTVIILIAAYVIVNVVKDRKRIHK